MNRIRNEQGNMTTDTKDIMNITRVYLKSYSPLTQKIENKWIHLTKYIQTTNVKPRIIDQQCKPITCKEIKTLIRSSPVKIKCQVTDGSQQHFTFQISTSKSS